MIYDPDEEMLEAVDKPALLEFPVPDLDRPD
jgi:hypothetical protein